VSDGRPNIVLVFTDQQRYDAVGVDTYGESELLRAARWSGSGSARVRPRRLGVGPVVKHPSACG
jgi:hypothetical protein